MHYRADIDGLRAVAVLSVLAFHYIEDAAFNGFMGVDIFFVISGFLITRILQDELEAGRFSLAGFYERRARRILPALFAVMLFTTVAAYFLFLPKEMISFGKSLIGTALFGSNFVFWSEASYFDLDAITKPLLHTWSLGIEEQFYIIFPLLLWVLYRFFRARIGTFLIALWVASFLGNIWLILNGEQNSAFYLPFSRAWELFTGAVLALGLIPVFIAHINKVAWSGALLIVLGLILPFDDQDFPGFYALLPVLGSALLIYVGAHSADHTVTRTLSHRHAVLIGKMSYSLYLWHWPLLVFAVYYELGDITIPQTLMLIAACFCISYYSWRYIEQPVRKKQAMESRRKVFLASLIGVLIFIMAGSFILSEEGKGPSYQERFAKILSVSEGGKTTPIDIDPGQETVAGIFGSTTDPANAKVALWGDSHAGAIAPALIKAAEETKETGLLITGNNCFLLPEYKDRMRKQDDCVDRTQRVLDYLSGQKQIRTIVLANHWAGHLRKWSKRIGAKEAERLRLESLLALIDALEKAGKKVVISGQTPEIASENQNIPSIIARIELYGRDIDLRPTPQLFDLQQKQIAPVFKTIEEQTPVQFIWPHKVLCDETACRIRDGDRLYYFDEDHLSTYGAEQLSGLFKPLF